MSIKGTSKSNFLILTIFTFIVANTSLAQKSSVKTAFEWPNGTKAAVCLTYDDALDCHIDSAMPVLEDAGLRGTFYCTGSSGSIDTRITEWRKKASLGHELGNHTLFHPCDGTNADWVKPEYDLTKYTLEQILKELKVCNTLLKAIDGNEERSFAYPCCNYIVSSGSIIVEMDKLFPSARAGGDSIPSNMMSVDPYFVPSFAVIDHPGEELIKLVKTAMERKTMVVFMFHSVGGGYLNVSMEAHQMLIDFLSKNKAQVWTDTFQHVCNYMVEEQNRVRSLK